MLSTQTGEESFTVYPMIEVSCGSVPGGADPMLLAREYAAAGATWVHLVDLDGARGGGWGLHRLVGKIVGETGLAVQSGGGVRGQLDMDRILRSGAGRAVAGSAATDAPLTVVSWLVTYGPEAIAVALDAHHPEFADLISRYAGAGLRHLIVRHAPGDPERTEHHRLIGELAPRLRVQAAGGMSSAADVRDVHRAGCAGALVDLQGDARDLDLVEALLAAL